MRVHFIKKESSEYLISTILFVIITVILISVPQSVVADEQKLGGTQNNTGEQRLGDKTQENKKVEKNVNAKSQLQNPLAGSGVGSIAGLLNKILDVILIFAIPIIVIFIIYAGFLYVVARGNPEKIKTANQTLLWVVIGALIIIGARAILQIVQGTVGNF